MELLEGKKVSEKILEELKEKVEKLPRAPKLLFIHMGENPGDLSYIRGAKKKLQKANMECDAVSYPLEITTEELAKEIQKWNEDDSVDGILLCRPFPAHIDGDKILETLSDVKDMDCATSGNAGRFYNGHRYMTPCTPEAVMEILKYYEINPDGKNVVILGRSEVVGKPLAILMLEKNGTVTICHSHTKDLKKVTSSADILVSAIGKAKFLDDEFLKEGAVFIDVGINVDSDGKLCGDGDFEKMSGKASCITPVPGGVGVVASTMLASHVYEACKNRFSD